MANKQSNEPGETKTPELESESKSKALYFALVVRDSAGEFTLKFESEAARNKARGEIVKKNLAGLDPIQTVNRGLYFPLNVAGVFVPDNPIT